MSPGPTIHRPEQGIRVLALVEATAVSGVVKNLLVFADTARRLHCPVELTVGLYQRASRLTPAASCAELAATLASRRIETRILPERHAGDVRLLSAVRRIIDECDPHVVQTHSLKSHAVIRASGAWRIRPWIAFHHGYTDTDLKVRFYNQFDRWSLRRARSVVAVSAVERERLIARGVAPSAVTVIHNAIGGEGPAVRGECDGRSPHGNDGRGHVLLSVGRLSREKGQRDLIAALGSLNRTAPALRWRLILVGSGPDRPALERAALRHGIAASVRFAGQVADVGPYYSSADVFVLPSRSEGSPNVVLEAAAARLPLVATAVGGVPDMLPAGTAFLVEPRNIPALADAIRRTLEQPGLARTVAEAARAHVLEAYSVERRCMDVCQLYAQAVSDWRHGASSDAATRGAVA